MENSTLTIIEPTNQSHPEENQAVRRQHIADEIYRFISYAEAAILVSKSIKSENGIKTGLLPRNKRKQRIISTPVILTPSDRALELYHQVCDGFGVELLDNPVSAQTIKKLHYLAFGEPHHGVSIGAGIRAYKALYKIPRTGIDIVFKEIATDTDIDALHKALNTKPDQEYVYKKFNISISGASVGKVNKIFYYVTDKNNLLRKKTTFEAEINYDGIEERSPQNRNLISIKTWIDEKLHNLFRDKEKRIDEYKPDRRGIIFAAMPLIAKLARMNSLLAKAPIGRDTNLIEWINKKIVDPDGVESFPNREFLSSLIMKI